LRLEDDHHGVTQDEARRIPDEPGWNRITSDDGCLDAFTHLCVYTQYCIAPLRRFDHYRDMNGQSMWSDGCGVKASLQICNIRFKSVVGGDSC
jgi:hypothetical protein